MRTCPDGTHCQNEDLLEDLAAERDRWATEVERLLEAIAWQDGDGPHGAAHAQPGRPEALGGAGKMTMFDDLVRLAQQLVTNRRPRLEIWVSPYNPPGDAETVGYELDVARTGIVPVNPRSEKVLLLHPTTFLRLEAQGLLPPGVPVYEPEARRTDEYLARVQEWLRLKVTLAFGIDRCVVSPGLPDETTPE